MRKKHCQWARKVCYRQRNFYWPAAKNCGEQTGAPHVAAVCSHGLTQGSYAACRPWGARREPKSNLWCLFIKRRDLLLPMSQPIVPCGNLQDIELECVRVCSQLLLCSLLCEEERRWLWVLDTCLFSYVPATSNMQFSLYAAHKVLGMIWDVHKNNQTDVRGRGNA